MFTLSDVRSQTLQYLGDPSSLHFTPDLIDLSVSHALSAYSAYFPNVHAEELTLPIDGRDQPLNLSGLSGSANAVIDILDIFYLSPPVSPISVPGHYLFSSGSSPSVHLSGSYVPSAGDVVAIRYSVSHTIAGLHGAVQTTVFPFHLNTLVVGAAAHAASIRAAAISEAYGAPTSDSNRLLLIASSSFALFNKMLSEIRTRSLNAPIVSDTPTSSPSWRLDQWDK